MSENFDSSFKNEIVACFYDKISNILIKQMIKGFIIAYIRTRSKLNSKDIEFKFVNQKTMNSILSNTEPQDEKHDFRNIINANLPKIMANKDHKTRFIWQTFPSLIQFNLTEEGSTRGTELLADIRGQCLVANDNSLFYELLTSMWINNTAFLENFLHSIYRDYNTSKDSENAFDIVKSFSNALKYSFSFLTKENITQFGLLNDEEKLTFFKDYLYPHLKKEFELSPYYPSSHSIADDQIKIIFGNVKDSIQLCYTELPAFGKIFPEKYYFNLATYFDYLVLETEIKSIPRDCDKLCIINEHPSYQHKFTYMNEEQNEDFFKELKDSIKDLQLDLELSQNVIIQMYLHNFVSRASKGSKEFNLEKYKEAVKNAFYTKSISIIKDFSGTKLNVAQISDLIVSETKISKSNDINMLIQKVLAEISYRLARQEVLRNYKIQSTEKQNDADNKSVAEHLISSIDKDFVSCKNYNDAYFYLDSISSMLQYHANAVSHDSFLAEGDFKRLEKFNCYDSLCFYKENYSSLTPDVAEFLNEKAKFHLIEPKNRQGRSQGI